MTEREFYKILKQKKLFSTFCLHIASVFADTPTSKKWYVNSLIQENRVDTFVKSMGNWENITNFKLIKKIQQ